MKRLTGCAAATATLALLYLPAAGAQDVAEPSPRTSDHGLEFYVSEDALQALYQRPTDLDEIGETHISLGFFLNEERDLVGMVDALLPITTPPRSRWTVQAGPRMYGALMNVEETDLFAVALGGQIQYSVWPDGQTTVALGGFYSPSILTFGEADNVRDVHLRVETPLANGVRIFFGYRLFEWDMTIGPTADPLAAQSRKVDDGFQLGLRAAF